MFRVPERECPPGRLDLAAHRGGRAAPSALRFRFRPAPRLSAPYRPASPGTPRADAGGHPASPGARPGPRPARPAEPRRRPGLQRHRVIPAPSDTAGATRRAQPPVEALLHKRLSPSRWALHAAGKRLKAGDRIEFGEASDRACMLASLARRSREGGRGRGHPGLRPAGPDLDMAIHERGADAPAAYIAPSGPEDRARSGRTTRPSMPARTARWPLPTAGPAFHAAALAR